jgi:hypothetical protein
MDLFKAVSRRPLTAETRVRSRGSVHVGFMVDKLALEQVSLRVLRFSPVSFIPPVLHYKEKRKKLIISITGLHNKPSGCGASVASAAGPFNKKKWDLCRAANKPKSQKKFGMLSEKKNFVFIKVNFETRFKEETHISSLYLLVRGLCTVRL